MDHTTSHDNATDKDAKRPLGKTAKSSSTLSHADAYEKRSERYQALSRAKNWLTPAALAVAPNRFPGDTFRTIDCRWIQREHEVKVHLAREFQSASFSGLVTCGNLWACPVCCVKIQERRRGELEQLIDWSYAQGFEVQMVTFTFPHTRFDSLSDLISKQRLAFRILRSGRIWQDFKKKYGFVGLVRSLELLYGRNGWHPHTHELFITDSLTPERRELFRDFVLSRWINACKKAGLLDASYPDALRNFQLYSVDVRYKCSASDYLAKQDDGRSWGVDRELVKSRSKNQSRGIHPHEFLVRGDKGDCAKYLEYVRGMKGSRQLFWSPGLKSRVGIVDVSDEELAEKILENADELGAISTENWAIAREAGIRADILSAAERWGWPGVLWFLEAVGGTLTASEKSSVDIFLASPEMQKQLSQCA